MTRKKTRPARRFTFGTPMCRPADDGADAIDQGASDARQTAAAFEADPLASLLAAAGRAKKGAAP